MSFVGRGGEKNQKLVDVADRGKPTLSGIAGPLRLGSVVRTSLQNLASAAGMCLLVEVKEIIKKQLDMSLLEQGKRIKNLG